MRPVLSLTLMSLLALVLPGCGGDSTMGESGGSDTDTDTEADTDTVVDAGSCVANLVLTLPDGTSTTLDYCQAYSLDATFAFDPEAPPEVRSPTLEFHAATDAALDCWVQITEPALCGEGFYWMEGSSGRVIVDTHDCGGIPDGQQGQYVTSTGYLRLDTVHAGDEPGDLSGELLETTMAGHLSVETNAGISLVGDFSISREVSATEAEEADCVVTDGDADGDGWIASDLGGDDCDDGDASLNLDDADGDGASSCDEDCDDSDSALNLADADSDGYSSCDDDCDDEDSDTFPGAAESDDSSACMSDADGDGWGSDSPVPGVDAGTDCDDSDSALNPADADSDGYSTCDGDCEDSDSALSPEDADNDGYASCDDDCDDADAARHPGATETCDGLDNDCDGLVDDDDTDLGDASTFYIDHDGDGHGSTDYTIGACEIPSGYVENTSDCDDTDASVNPDASEVCDGQDNDCDGDVDDADAGLTGPLDTFYDDTDLDGYGDPASSSQSCAAASGHVEDATDCDDTDGAIHPGATEVCDEADNDCDGLVDDEDIDLDGTDTFYIDHDGDGHGSTDYTTESCEAPSGYVDNATDCDDGDADNHPDATEVCDEIDNNCDGDIDEEGALNGATWYGDGDGDGYGDPASTTESCEAASGYVDDASDCDDDDSAIHPGATEVCDEVDNDCDGLVDDEDIDVDGTSTFYIDHDEDGHGSTDYTTESCQAPSGYVSDATDCDDTDADNNPDALEMCDGEDNDCDGLVDDEDTSPGGTSTFYIDSDGDGYGSTDSTAAACEAPSGHVDDDTDCDDADPAIHPDATESCDGTDDDCDGETDEDATEVLTWYADSDGDGYGDSASTTDACEVPSGHVDDATDCDDERSGVYPIDSDGDGITDFCGYTSVSAGYFHTCALDSAGAIACWGWDGQGNISDVPLGSGYTVVSAGGHHTCALDSTGVIECWGQDDMGQASDAPGGSGYTDLSGGSYHICALDSAGSIKCWGSDNHGQVTGAPSGVGYTAVTGGASHSCALDSSGAIACWGSDSDGQITDALSGSGYTAVSAGLYHTCVLEPAGTIECWGSDSSGQVTGGFSGSDYTFVSGGGYYTCAMDSAGSIECWGYDRNGEVTDAPTDSGYTAMSAGGFHSCALDPSGSIACWGYDIQGQVSDAP